MDAEFWRGKWRDGQLGWHQPAAHPMLVRHLPSFGLERGARVFVPLCGKTLDIGWLLASGYAVAGAELVEEAIVQLFAELRVAPEIHQLAALKRYRAQGIDIFVGDIFALDRETLGPVDAVYDRAALVALPAETRVAYAGHLVAITQRAPQLIVSFDYDQSLLQGPPFSVLEREIRELYQETYDVALLERAALSAGLKGRHPADELALRLY